MPDKVFISYSSADHALAQVVCQTLETNGLHCWIAPRDIIPGQSYADGIMGGIEAAKVVVLIWSVNTDASDWVMSELERARSKKIPIIPFRVDNVQPIKELEFYISRSQWLDAFEAPIERHFDRLVKIVTRYGTMRVDPYLAVRMGAHQDFLNQPNTDAAEKNAGVKNIEDLRVELAEKKRRLKEPEPIKVRGTLFPCALLSSGWWEKRKAEKGLTIDWSNGLQEWLFHGFDLWGPSWDMTGGFLASKREGRYVIAQLGEGDEANSIPVLIPPSKAERLQDELTRKGWGGMEAEVSCLLGHRSHFAKDFDKDVLEVFGGLLDYCLWLRDDDKDHYIHRLATKTPLYSGYLWKCVAPTNTLNGSPGINDVYFIWEHSNFADSEALAYALEAMNFKEEQVRKKTGSDLTLIHKSSGLVPGTPAYSAEAIYRMLLGKSGESW